MATLADVIEAHIKRMLARAGGSAVEIRRCDVAEQFACVPSQINYVLETRFTPRDGYYVESRRGGGGYIRITQAYVRRGTLSLRAIADEIGNRIGRDQAEALLARLAEMGVITLRQRAVIHGTLRHELAGVGPPLDEHVRAKLLRAMLLVAVSDRRDR